MDIIYTGKHKVTLLKLLIAERFIESHNSERNALLEKYYNEGHYLHVRTNVRAEVYWIAQHQISEKYKQTNSIDEFLSWMKHPYTLGGKQVQIDSNSITVEGNTISKEILKKIYDRTRDNPIIIGGYTVKLRERDGKYVKVIAGCIEATIEEIEALAKELKLS